MTTKERLKKDHRMQEREESKLEMLAFIILFVAILFIVPILFGGPMN